ncbi:MAG: DUF933 domain-containing protein [Dehalococcoidia bacterium]
MDLALIGLPQSGKTSLFQALAAGRRGPLVGKQEHIAVVKLSDERLDRLADLFQSKKITYAEIRLHDLPVAFQGGVALSSDLAPSLAGADALVHVVRAFHRDDVPHSQGTVEPHRDIAALDAELLFHDLAIVERRLERLVAGVRSLRPADREAGERELTLLRHVKDCLEQDIPLRARVFTPDEGKQLANYGLLSLKPLLLAINIDENDCPNAPAIESDYRARYAAASNGGGSASGRNTGVVAVCAKLEAELAELPEEEADQFRQELGATDSAVQRLFRLAQQVLGLVTFYTVVGDECRAWPLPAGTTALRAAAKIHSDMERGFIRAEAIAWDKLLELGSLAEAKKHGLLRSEGKGYAVQDGDVLHILFHV